MHTIKIKMLAAAMLLFAITTNAQSEIEMQKAFADSYTQEYNKAYSDAITTLNKVYNAKSYEINLRLGWLNYLNKTYQQSQDYYQKAVTLKPYAIEAKLGLAKPLSALESWDKLLQTYEEIIKIDAQNNYANYWAGIIHYNRKKYENAAKYFEKLVNLYPFDYDANHMLAWTYLNLGRNGEAKILFNKALLNKPGDASCLEGMKKIK